MVERMEKAHDVFAIDHREALSASPSCARDLERRRSTSKTPIATPAIGVPVEQPSIALDESIGCGQPSSRAGLLAEQLRPSVAQACSTRRSPYRQHESEQALGQRGAAMMIHSPTTHHPPGRALRREEQQQRGEFAGDGFDVGGGVARKEYETEAGREDDAGDNRRCERRRAVAREASASRTASSPAIAQGSRAAASLRPPVTGSKQSRSQYEPSGLS